MRDKTVEDAMTPLQSVFMMETSVTLDTHAMNEVLNGCGLINFKCVCVWLL